MKYLIILFIALVGQALGAAVHDCHMEKLSACGDPLSEFRKKMGKSFPIDNDQVTELCTKMNEAYKCVEDFQNKCMTPMQLQTMGFLTEGSLIAYREFCEDGSKLRADYLKHAKCIDDSSKTPEAKERASYVEAALENLAEMPPHQRLPTACCGYALLMEKSTQIGEEKCGKEAVDSFNKVVEMAVSSLPNVFCSGFEPEGKVCKSVLPPPGTKPKGNLKKSHITQTFMSMYFDDLKEE